MEDLDRTSWEDLRVWLEAGGPDEPDDYRRSKMFSTAPYSKATLAELKKLWDAHMDCSPADLKALVDRLTEMLDDKETRLHALVEAQAEGSAVQNHWGQWVTLYMRRFALDFMLETTVRGHGPKPLPLKAVFGEDEDDLSAEAFLSGGPSSQQSATIDQDLVRAHAVFVALTQKEFTSASDACDEAARVLRKIKQHWEGEPIDLVSGDRIQDCMRRIYKDELGGDGMMTLERLYWTVKTYREEKDYLTAQLPRPAELAG
jgi:hypothetical protein